MLTLVCVCVYVCMLRSMCVVLTMMVRHNVRVYLNSLRVNACSCYAANIEIDVLGVIWFNTTSSVRELSI